MATVARHPVVCVTRPGKCFFGSSRQISCELYSTNRIESIRRCAKQTLVGNSHYNAYSLQTRPPKKSSQGCTTLETVQCSCGESAQQSTTSSDCD